MAVTTTNFEDASIPATNGFYSHLGDSTYRVQNYGVHSVSLLSSGGINGKYLSSPASAPDTWPIHTGISGLPVYWDYLIKTPQVGDPAPIAIAASSYWDSIYGGTTILKDFSISSSGVFLGGWWSNGWSTGGNITTGNPVVPGWGSACDWIRVSCSQSVSSQISFSLYTTGNIYRNSSPDLQVNPSDTLDWMGSGTPYFYATADAIYESRKYDSVIGSDNVITRSGEYFTTLGTGGTKFSVGSVEAV